MERQVVDGTEVPLSLGFFEARGYPLSHRVRSLALSLSLCECVPACVPITA